MKKGLLFLMLSALTIGAWADVTYTPLSYIENSEAGRSTQYFDTGYTPNSNTKVEIKFRITSWYIDSSDKWAAIFSGRTSNTNGISLFVNGSDTQLGYFVSDLGGNGDKFLNQTLSLNTDYTATANLSNLTVTDGTNNYSKNTEKTEWKTTKQSIRLFSDASNNEAFQGRIYYCNIYEGDAIKHRFIPMLKEENGAKTPCFYCTICKDFATKGSGTFSFGMGTREYTSVEYIEYPSDGAENITRVFDTNYIPNKDTKVKVKFRGYDPGNKWRAIFSGRDGVSNNTGMSLYQNGDGSHLGYFVGNLGSGGNTFASYTTSSDCVVEASLGTLVVDGTSYSTGQSSFNATTRSITLFANPEWDQIFKGRIYYFQIYEGETLVHNFVPMKATPDNSIGFFDTVNGKYITTRTYTDAQYFNAGPNYNSTDPEVTLTLTRIADGGSTASEPASNLFDGYINTKWCKSGGARSNWVVFKTNMPVYLTEYTLRTANDCVYRDPKKFQLYGALDSAPTQDGTITGWTQIDSETDANDVIPIERYAKATFEVDNPGIYQYYMLKIDAPRDKHADGSGASSQELQLAEFFMSKYGEAITSDSDLEDFTAKVNGGATSASAILTADVSTSSVIGNDANRFCGCIDGQGHKVNLTINGSTDDQAFIGVATGGAMIKNLILTGSVTNTGKKTGGFIAEAKGGGDITITNCGNEATISGAGGETAAIVANNLGSSCTLIITNVYNIGDVSGSGDVAAICAHQNSNSDSGGSSVFTNVYNSGNLTGAKDGYFVRYSAGSGEHNGATYTNCYSTSLNKGSGKKDHEDITLIESSHVNSGELCYLLNGNQSNINWYQDLSCTNTPKLFEVTKQVAAGKWFNDADNDVYYNLEGGNYIVFQLNMSDTNTKYAVPDNVTATNVSVSRNMTAGQWIGLCLPFSYDIPSGWDVRELASVVGSGESASMRFSSASSIEAGKPYIVKPSSAVTEPITATNKDIATAASTLEEGDVNMIGNFAQTAIATGSYYINTASELKKLTGSAVNMKGFRAYFTVDNNVKALIFDLDDDATSIEHSPLNIDHSEGAIFNVAGQRIQKMQKGIYIVNGKKILK